MIFKQTQKIKFLRQISLTKKTFEQVKVLPPIDTTHLITLSKSEIEQFYTKNLNKIFAENQMKSLDQEFKDSNIKFKVLSQVVKQFGKNVPSPLLRNFKTGKDVCKWLMEEKEKEKPEPEVKVPENLHMHHTKKLKKIQRKELIPKKEKKEREEVEEVMNE